MSRRKGDNPSGIKPRGKYGEPWLHNIHPDRNVSNFVPVHLDEAQKAKYRDDARRRNVEIWSRPDDGVGAGDLIAFTSLKLPEQGEPIADRICACVNEFAGLDTDDVIGVLDTLRKLLMDIEAGRCKPGSARLRAARNLIAKRKAKESGDGDGGSDGEADG